jgi:hypothetical protein
MYRSYQASGVFGKVAHLALLGVGILFLGPIALGLAATALGIAVALVGVAAPFVLIGAIGYGPYLLVRRVFGGPRRQVPMEARRVVPQAAPPARPVPVRVAIERPETPRPETPRPARRPRGVVARVVSEVLCGALLGGTLGGVAVIGTVGTWQTGALLDYAGLGMAIGAVVGFVVGGPRPAPVEKTATV